MKCPHCNNQIDLPVARQVEAYRLVYIDGLSQQEAAEAMGVSASTVSRLLSRLAKLRPELFPHAQKVMAFGYSDSMGKIKCKHCGRLVGPSAKQIEAYRLVHIVGLSQQEVSELMGIQQPAVSRLLNRLAELRPELFVNQPVEIISYDDSMANQVMRQW